LQYRLIIVWLFLNEIFISLPKLWNYIVEASFNDLYVFRF